MAYRTSSADLETTSLLSGTSSCTQRSYSSPRGSVNSISSRSRAESVDDSGGEVSCVCCSKWHPSRLVIIISVLGISEGILSNLDLFLEYHGLLKLSAVNINTIVLLVACVPQVLAVVTGSLGDSRFSRVVILYWGLLLQFLGSLCLLACAAVERYTEYSIRLSQLTSKHALQILVLVGLVLISVGVAAIEGSTIVLGMEQYWRRGESAETAKYFFPLFYWAINAVAALVVGLLSFVQLNFGFFIGLIPTCISYGLSFLIIHCFWGRLYYTHHLTENGGFGKVWKVFREAWRVSRAKKQKVPESSRTHRPTNTVPLSWWSYAELNFGGRFHVNDIMDVRNFISLLLVLLPTLFFSIIMSQTLTSFTTQGSRMKLPAEPPDSRGNNHDYQLFLPASGVASVSAVAVCFFIPILYLCVYPSLERSQGWWRLTLFRRMGIGMIVAVLSLACATTVEVNRTARERWNATIHFDPVLYSSNHTASSLSIFWQVPQYALSGLAETLVYISALEFAYAKSPQTMKGLCIGLVYAMSGLSGLLSAGLMSLMVANSANFYYRDDKPGYVQWFFMALGGVILIGIGIFTVTTRHYKFLRRTSMNV